MPQVLKNRSSKLSYPVNSFCVQMLKSLKGC